MIQTALLLRYGTCLHVAFLLSNVLWLFFEEVDYSGAVPIWVNIQKIPNF